MVFRRSFHRRLSFSVLPEMESQLLGRSVPLDRLVFMDTETTGLGGAGVVVFLVGAGSVVGDTVVITQILLTDYPGEPDFLDVVADLLGNCDAWVSYNGKAFDSKLLESRFLIHGRSPLSIEQLDLLYWSRRLWKRLIGNCRLGDVEARVFGAPRIDDIPGIEIPDRFFSFLNSGDALELAPVFEHHIQDIVTLVMLFNRIEDTLSDPLSSSFVDRYQLGRYLIRRGREEGLRMLRAVLVSPTENEPDDVRERAGLALGTALRRYGDHGDAVKVWGLLHEMGSVSGTIELAKVLEHRDKDFEQAKRVVARALRGVGSGPLHAALVHRLDRLCRKLALKKKR